MIHLAVEYKDGQMRYYPVPPEQGWKIDTMQRMIVIGRHVPRTLVPLDNVFSITLEECA